jgi:hypothetical protein
MNKKINLTGKCQLGFALPVVMIDLKKDKSRKIELAIREKAFESRRGNVMDF